MKGTAMNTRNTRNTSPNLLPEGTYRAKFHSAEWDNLGNNKGVRFVVDIDHNGNAHPVNGVLFMSKEKADARGRTSFDRSCELLTGLGWSDEKGRRHDFSPCEGKEVMAVVQHERNPETGRVYHKVAFLNLPMRARAFRPPTRDEVDALFDGDSAPEDMSTPFDMPGDVPPGSAATDDPEDIAF